MILGLLPVLGRVVAAVPTPVLGGAGVVLFGSVAASGIRTLAKVDYSRPMNLIIVAASISFGMIPIAKPDFYDQFPTWFGIIFHSGISSAAVMAILLNLLFNHLKLGTPPDPSVFAAGAEHGANAVDDEDLEDLQDDGVLNGSTRRPVAVEAAAPSPRPRRRTATAGRTGPPPERATAPTTRPRRATAPPRRASTPSPRSRGPRPRSAAQRRARRRPAPRASPRAGCGRRRARAV